MAQAMVSISGSTVNMRAGPSLRSEVLVGTQARLPAAGDQAPRPLAAGQRFRERPRLGCAQPDRQRRRTMSSSRRTANMRKGPGTNTAIVAKAEYGETLRTLGPHAASGCTSSAPAASRAGSPRACYGASAARRMRGCVDRGRCRDERTRTATALSARRALPAPGATIEVAPGIRWVRMGLPFALDHINLWMLRDRIDGRDGWTLVDCGIANDATRERLGAGLFEPTRRPAGAAADRHPHASRPHRPGGLADPALVDTRSRMPDVDQRDRLQRRAARPSTPIPASAAKRCAFHGQPRPERSRMRSRRSAAAATTTRSMVPAVPPSYRRMLDGDHDRDRRPGAGAASPATAMRPNISRCTANSSA